MSRNNRQLARHRYPQPRLSRIAGVADPLSVSTVREQGRRATTYQTTQPSSGPTTVLSAPKATVSRFIAVGLSSVLDTNWRSATTMRAIPKTAVTLTAHTDRCFQFLHKRTPAKR